MPRHGGPPSGTPRCHPRRDPRSGVGARTRAGPERAVAARPRRSGRDARAVALLLLRLQARDLRRDVPGGQRGTAPSDGGGPRHRCARRTSGSGWARTASSTSRSRTCRAASCCFSGRSPGSSRRPRRTHPRCSSSSSPRDRLADIGITTPELLDVWTATLSGSSSSSGPTIPDGDRWTPAHRRRARHVPRVREEAAVLMDATEFCRVLSGRGDGEGLLTQEVPF